jgi:uncharacterized protein YegL
LFYSCICHAGRRRLAIFLAFSPFSGISGAIIHYFSKRNNMQRVPVYLLLETSGCMKGFPLELLERGMLAFARSMQRDVSAAENSRISLIAFGTKANLAFPLTEPFKLKIPRFEAEGAVSTGEALGLAASQARKELAASDGHGPPDCKPLFFLMTSSFPTDDISSRLPDFLACDWAMRAAFGIGREIDGGILREIAGENAFLAETFEENDAVKEIFEFIGACILSHIKNLGAGIQKMPPEDLPPLPPGLRRL